MLDLILNATRVLFSDDVRKTASSLLDAVRRSPEWQHDICELSATIDKRFREQAALISHVAAGKLRALDYSVESVDDFQTAYHELTTNAFEHGCQRITDDIRLALSVTPAYVSLLVQNPRRSPPIDLDAWLNRSSAQLRGQTVRTRGRGLLLVNELADSFEQVDPKGVKAVVYRDRVGILGDTVEDVAVVFNFSGSTNPSLVRRLRAACEQHREKDILLRFGWNDTAPRKSTDVARAVIEIHGIQASASKRLVTLYSREADVFLPDHLSARSWRDALEEIGRVSLLHEVEAAFARIHNQASQLVGRPH